MRIPTFIGAILLSLSVLAAPAAVAHAQQCYNTAGAPIKCREDKQKKQAVPATTPTSTPTPIPSPTPTVTAAGNAGAVLPSAPDAPAPQGSDGNPGLPDDPPDAGLPPASMLVGMLAIAGGILGGGVLLFKRRTRAGDAGSQDSNVDFYFNPKEIDVDKPEPFAKHHEGDDAPGRGFAKWSPNWGGQTPPDPDMGALPDQHLSSLPDQHLSSAGMMPPPDPDLPNPSGLGATSRPDVDRGGSWATQDPPEPDKTRFLPDQHLSNLPPPDADSPAPGNLGSVTPPDPDKPGGLPEPSM